MDIEVERGELTHWRVTDPPSRPLAEGEARLRIDRFGFSSNNVSYAVIGDLLRYWEAFPASRPTRGRQLRGGGYPCGDSPTWWSPVPRMSPEASACSDSSRCRPS